jgi:hypothetical protein
MLSITIVTTVDPHAIPIDNTNQKRLVAVDSIFDYSTIFQITPPYPI